MWGGYVLEVSCGVFCAGSSWVPMANKLQTGVLFQCQNGEPVFRNPSAAEIDRFNAVHERQTVHGPVPDWVAVRFRVDFNRVEAAKFG